MQIFSENKPLVIGNKRIQAVYLYLKCAKLSKIYGLAIRSLAKENPYMLY
ncbi:hypothetical protein F542_20930 [Bibersteinia trehalosi USDA-ARS-USMARC-188]|uniref:Uncharacterized protein n=2 Tax=Bibersteinia trehalosi TaxID=47735 RepID=A0A4V7ID25_BIBTR|nr:hypothetical protein WQG_640 [Bibersteinia trehalosi USDA-ARS-USMARC-192]AHG82802.1 hypothetical protein F542_20930 [Bibersteinia trehalosi USDA-ARS-USMARC-188]AHG85176.1 hypothetical protein F543_23210 [Bibersteinia trehalosi USDA-ARS-USMARC-189]